MIDRQQLESILGRRFPGAPLEQIAAAANAIMGLDREAPADPQCATRGCGCESCGERDEHEVAPPLPCSHA